MEKPLILGHVVGGDVYFKHASLNQLFDWAADGMENPSGVRLVRHLQKMFDGAADEVRAANDAAGLPDTSNN